MLAFFFIDLLFFTHLKVQMGAKFCVMAKKLSLKGVETDKSPPGAIQALPLFVSILVLAVWIKW